MTGNTHTTVLQILFTKTDRVTYIENNTVNSNKEHTEGTDKIITRINENNSCSGGWQITPMSINK